MKKLVLTIGLVVATSLTAVAQKEFINNPCYQSLLKFRKENDVVLQNDMIERLRCNDLEFKEKLKNLLLSDIFKTHRKTFEKISWY